MATQSIVRISVLIVAFRGKLITRSLKSLLWDVDFWYLQVPIKEVIVEDRVAQNWTQTWLGSDLEVASNSANDKVTARCLLHWRRFQFIGRTFWTFWMGCGRPMVYVWLTVSSFGKYVLVVIISNELVCLFLNILLLLLVQCFLFLSLFADKFLLFVLLFPICPFPRLNPLL